MKKEQILIFCRSIFNILIKKVLARFLPKAIGGIYGAIIGIVIDQIYSRAIKPFILYLLRKTNKNKIKKGVRKSLERAKVSGNEEDLINNIDSIL